MKRVRVTRDAERDLDEIWLRIARDSADAANHFVDELAARFVFIGPSPEMRRSRDEVKPGVRSHPVGSYVIYRVARAYIYILHIIHGARDSKRAFGVAPRLFQNSRTSKNDRHSKRTGLQCCKILNEVFDVR